MKTKMNADYKKIAIVLAIILAIISAIIVIKIIFFSATKIENVNYDEPTSEQIEAGNKAKDDFIDRTEYDIKEVIDKEEIVIDKTKNANVAMTTIDFNGGFLSVRTMISGVDSVGTCRATVFNSAGEKIIEESAPTQIMHGYYLCQGFDFEGVSAGGSIRVDYSDQNNFAGTATGDF